MILSNDVGNVQQLLRDENGNKEKVAHTSVSLLRHEGFVSSRGTRRVPREETKPECLNNGTQVWSTPTLPVPDHYVPRGREV